MDGRKRKRKADPKSKTNDYENDEENDSAVTKEQRSATREEPSVKRRKLTDTSAARAWNVGARSKYPPPCPRTPPHNTKPSWKNVPAAPTMTANTEGNVVTLTWDVKSAVPKKTAKIIMYELYVCKETEEIPISSMWQFISNLEPYKLPIDCKLGPFQEGFKYHFALRAVDVHERRTPFAVVCAPIPLNDS